MSPIQLSPLTAIHLSPNLAGCVQLYVCLQFICLPLRQFICLPVWLLVSRSPDVSYSFVPRLQTIHLSPIVAGGVRLSGCLQLIFLPLLQFICLGWCLALRMSPIDLSPVTAIHLSPSLACGVWLSGCLQFICFPL